MNTATFTLNSKKNHSDVYEATISIGDKLEFEFEKPKNWHEYQHTAKGVVRGFKSGGETIVFECTDSTSIFGKYVVGGYYTMNFAKAYDAIRRYIRNNYDEKMHAI